MSERLWFKIGEAAQRIGATPKELRYWEKVIPELKPRRSKGNLRYYHVEEIPRLQKIREWLAEGLTVADCRQLLLTGHLARPLLDDLALETTQAAISAPEVPRPAASRRSASTAGTFPDLKPVVKALQALVKRLSKPPLHPYHEKPELDQDSL